MAATKQLAVSNLLFHLGWREVKRWFRNLLGPGAVLYCRLFPSKRLGQNNSGNGILTLSSAELVQRVLEQASVALVRGRQGQSTLQHCLLASIGHRGILRLVGGGAGRAQP